MGRAAASKYQQSPCLPESFQALHGVSFDVNEGEIVALLGSNGAGKTSTLRTISGLTEAAEGKIRYYDKDITNMDTEKIAKLGMAQSPEGRQIFGDLTVEENLKAGAYTQKSKARVQENMQRVYKMFPVLEQRRKQQASTLSGGEQQMLAIGRALMADPKLLLLDEPSLGLAPLIIEDIFRVLQEIRSGMLLWS